MAECFYTEIFQTGTIATNNAWTELDLSSYGVPPSAVVEVVISLDYATPYNIGVRSVGSSLNRYIYISDQLADKECITMHVTADADSCIEAYTGRSANTKFEIVGYWSGCTYVEKFENFNISNSTQWDGKSLTSYGVSGTTVVEIAGANTDTAAGREIGIRSSGSSETYLFDLRNNHNFATTNQCLSFLVPATSGAIEIYAEDKDDATFWLLGYFDNPPGTFTEDRIIFSEPASTGWTTLDVGESGVPDNSVAQFLMIRTSGTGTLNIGIRESISSLERKISSLDRVDSPPDGYVYTSFSVNVDDTGTIDRNVSAISAADSKFILTGYWTDFINYSLVHDQIDFVIFGHESVSGIFYCNIHGIDDLAASGDLYIPGCYKHNDNIDLFIKVPEEDSFDCYIYGQDITSGTLDLYCLSHETLNNSGQLYMKGYGIIPHSGQHPLFTYGHGHHEESGDAYIHGHTDIVASGNLFLKVPEPYNQSCDLFLANYIDPCSGLIRDYDAIFYLKNYNDTELTHEYIKDINWDVPGLHFYYVPFIGIYGATSTAGDGTLPKYNDLGKGYASTQDGYALIGTTPKKQNIVGHIYDYSYAGSGSITAAFWMSGAHTIGNVVEVGWFYRATPFSDIGIANPYHSVGIRIDSTSGITVRTTVRDLPYDQLEEGGLWWGGTTHYGTPTSTTGSYRTWEESWSTINIEHDDIAFVAIRSEFIPYDGDIPNHMKVYLSIDGQPWTYIGSGLTGPPASSVVTTDPVNPYPENAVGVRVQAVNFSGGYNNCSIGVSEIALWSDTTVFSNSELEDLYDTVAIYYRPLDEYKPTIVPRQTYVQRTIGPFEYDPSNIDIGYVPGILCSGCLVTIEVGIGNYGEDAFAYLLEEIPPSGFVIRNISPAQVTYLSQGDRPAARQQIFHDPQSGILEPYGHGSDSGNIYGGAIRWINHNNNPEHNQRRSPAPTKTFTYELYPLITQANQQSEPFNFSGSGIFFGSASGIFVTETTGDTSGTIDTLDVVLCQSGCNLYITGPSSISGTIDLYLRTVEPFTSMFIGIAPTTPDGAFAVFSADGLADIETMAGIEYGPPLYTRGPRFYNDSLNMIVLGPIADLLDFYINGHILVSGDISLYEYGHETTVESGSLYISGPLLSSGSISLHTRAGAFEPPIDLYALGHDTHNDQFNLFIKGPEFICVSGNFAYPLDPDLFTYPSGGKSPDLSLWGYMDYSGSCDLYIGPGKQLLTWTFFLKTSGNSLNENVNLFTYGHPSGSSSVGYCPDSIILYIAADDADYPYTGGGTEAWTLFIKAQSGNLATEQPWTMFLCADTTTSGISNLYTYGHASGSLPHGNEFYQSCILMIENIPDDPDSIGYIPFNVHGDPWTLFLRVNQGWFDNVGLYISGNAPVDLMASGNLFIEGFLEQSSGSCNLYLLGISGIFGSGFNLFLDAITQVYNTNENLYVHGY